MLKDFDEALAKYVRPGSFPLAIRMVRDGEELSERTRRPLRDMNIKVAVCQTFSMARRYGWQLAVGEEDINCPLALTAFGMKKEMDIYDCGAMCAGMFTETKQAGAKTEAMVPKFSFKEYKYVLAAPISRADFIPQVYLVYGNSAQVMRLLAAALYKKGGYLTSKFSARLDCADICIETMKTGKPQVILPCYGDRVFGQTGDDEMAMSIPVGLEEEVIKGLAGTHIGGIRYPVPVYLGYTPEYPEHYDLLTKAWDEEKKGTKEEKDKN